MKIIFSLALILLSSLLSAQNIRSLKFDDLRSEIQNSGDTLMIVNFWATWCKPCIDELPLFEKTNQEYSNQNVKVILVNLDFNSKLQVAVEPFMKKKQIQSPVYHLTDSDPNEWIDQVDPSWSGAIPATVIYLKGEKKFFLEGEIKEKDLLWELEKTLDERSEIHFLE